MSIRNAVSQAVGRHAASSKLSAAGMGTRFAAGHHNEFRKRPVVTLRQKTASRVEGLVATAGGRVANDGVDDDRVALRVDARRVTTENPGQFVDSETDAAKAPDVVMIESGRPHAHDGPALGRRRIPYLTDLRPGQRIGGIERRHDGGQHEIDATPPARTPLTSTTPVTCRIFTDAAIMMALTLGRCTPDRSPGRATLGPEQSPWPPGHTWEVP